MTIDPCVWDRVSLIQRQCRMDEQMQEIHRRRLARLQAEQISQRAIASRKEREARKRR